MPIVGLQFDLSAWRKGVRDAAQIVKKGLANETLKPFDKAVKDLARDIKKRLGDALDAVKEKAAAIGRGLKRIVAIIIAAATAGLYTLQRVAKRAIGEWWKFQDSLVVVKAAVDSLKDGLKTGFTFPKLAQFRRDVVHTYGIMGEEVNRIFADLLTSGFDTRQARELALLSVNVAKKTAQPLEAVQRAIADAVSGNVDSLKRLGIQIESTNDLVMDGQRALAMLRRTYGGVGAELVNPSERLKANMKELQQVLGQKLAPILEPLVQKASDFVLALTNTAEGRAILDNIAEKVRTVVGWVGRAINDLANFATMAKDAGRVVAGTLKGMGAQIVELVADFTGRILHFKDFIVGTASGIFQAIAGPPRPVLHSSPPGSTSTSRPWCGWRATATGPSRSWTAWPAAARRFARAPRPACAPRHRSSARGRCSPAAWQPPRSCANA